MDLLFPHHECEIAQSQAAHKHDPAKYWMHNNMITINGQKMSKSLNNFITLDQLFAGEHEALDQAYAPMTVRFFILQAHYRGTLDFSNDALKAAEKGFRKLMNSIITASTLSAGENSTSDIPGLVENCEKAVKDDLSTAALISHLFEGVRITNSVKTGEETISKDDLALLNKMFEDYAVTILGFQSEIGQTGQSLVDPLMELILDIREDARANKNFDISDKIRDALKGMKINTKDEKDGTSWTYDG